MFLRKLLSLLRLSGRGSHKQTSDKHRTIRYGIVAVVVLALLGTVLFIFERTTNMFERFTDSLAPNTHASVDVQNALNEVRLPASINLVEGTGTSSATIETSKYAFSKRIPGAGSHTRVNISGTVTLVVPAKAMTLRAVQANGTWRTEAIVNTNVLKVTKDTKIANPPVVTDGLGRRIGAVVTGSDAGVRLQVATEHANTVFQNNCAEPLARALPAGTAVYVQELLRSVHGVVGADAAEILDDLAKQPVTVTLQQNGKPVSPNAVQLPQLPPLNIQDTANKIGVDDILNVDFGTDSQCKLAPKAAEQLAEYTKRYGG